MDAFLASGALPFAVLNLAIGDLGFVLIPLLMQYEKKGEERQVLESSFTALSLLAVAITVIGVWGHRWILRMTTAASMPAQTFELAASIAPAIWVIMGLTVIGSFLTGIHHYRRSFAIPAMTQALPYLGMIAGGLLGASRIGILSVAIGWVLGTLLRNIALYQFMAQPRMRLSGTIQHPAVARLFKSAFSLGISLLPFTVLPVIDTFWASRLPVGSISYLGYATRIVIALTGIVVQGICVVLFTDLSEDVANNRIDSFHRKMVQAIDAILLAIVPLAILVMTLRSPLIAALLQRGKFAPSATMGVAQVLPFYLLGMIFMAPMAIVNRGFYALGDYATPSKLGLVSLAVYIAVSGLLIRHYSYVGIGIAYAVFWCFTLLLQSYALGKTVGSFLQQDLLVFFGKVVLSSLFAAGVVAWIADSLCSSLGRFSGLSCAAIVGVVFFVALTHFVFRIPQFRILLSAVTRR